ncbi:helix-turn-helix transcriptional regulator [Streptomyces sp. NPDC050315]|uniref:helix-turn-helix domain-containing protein n=1 Tax=Streptomyces sp. NPDC050315 TaxID=3155039 RepID=UPI0034477BC6
MDVGWVVKMCRERAGLTQAELGDAIGYSEEQVSSVERGRRLPKPQFLDAAEEALRADGAIVGMKREVEEARYPKKVRDLAKLEAVAVEMGAYNNSVIHGLLQTKEYAQAVYTLRRPLFSEEDLEQRVAARMARKDVIHSTRAFLSFVQDEVTLRRPIGGRMVMRQQLEHLLEVGQLRNVDIQVMPTDREDHAGLDGSFRLLTLEDGTTVGHNEVQLVSGLISDAKEVRILEMRYGIIRARALTPRESLAFIEKVRGET